MVKVSAVDREYIESEVWKCGKSPTGAHHWTEIESDHARGLFYCIYCFDARKFPITLEQANKATGKTSRVDFESIEMEVV